MKTGRNDPCPCGSGKKYKRCCGASKIIPFPVNEKTHPPEGIFSPDQLEDMVLNSTGFADAESLDRALKEYNIYCEDADGSGVPLLSFMEFRGRPNQASAVINDLTTQMKSREFSSKKELEDFLNDQTRQQNTVGNPDFLGLSSAQMHSLLYGSLEENSDFVRLNPNPDPVLADKTSAVGLAKAIFQALVENGGSLPLTSAGNLKRVACNRIYELHSPLPIPEGMTLRSEDDLMFSRQTRQILDDLGLIHTIKTKIKLTEQGRMLWERKDWGRLYAGMFRIEMTGYDWLEDTLLTKHCRIVQDSALFSLYLLKKIAEKAVSYNTLYSAFLKAFPQVGEFPTVPGGLNNMRAVYEYFFFDFFALRYGLCRADRGDRNEVRYVITDLFRDFLYFQLMD